jgi:hypothetical protein
MVTVNNRSGLIVINLTGDEKDRLAKAGDGFDARVLKIVDTRA